MIEDVNPELHGFIKFTKRSLSLHKFNVFQICNGIFVHLIFMKIRLKVRYVMTGLYPNRRPWLLQGWPKTI